MTRSRSLSTRTIEKSGSGCATCFPIHTRVMTRTNFCKNKFLYRSGGPGYRGDRHSPRAGCASAYGDAWLLVRRGIMTEAVAAFTDFCFENFRSAEYLRRYLRTIWRRLVFSRKPASFSKVASRTTSSKTESFSIHSSTRRRGRKLPLLCPR